MNQNSILPFYCSRIEAFLQLFEPFLDTFSNQKISSRIFNGNQEDFQVALSETQSVGCLEEIDLDMTNYRIASYSYSVRESWKVQ